MPIDRSAGYKGTVKDKQWAGMISHVGSSLHGVASPTDWAPSIAPGDRAVKISAGIGWGLGVQDEMDDDHTVNLDPITSGTQRWDMIVARRAWAEGTGGTTTFETIKGAATQALPARSIGFPLDDQPIALCRVALNSGASVLTDVINLNVVPGTDALHAFDELALTWLTEFGKVVQVGSFRWRRTKDVMGVHVWVRQDVSQASAPITSSAAHWGFTWPGDAHGAVQRSGDRVHMRGLLSNTGVVSVAPAGHYKVGTIPSEFAPAQQAAFPTLTGTGTGPSTLSVFPNGDVYLDTYYAASGFSAGFFICWLDGFSWPAKPAAG